MPSLSNSTTTTASVSPIPSILSPASRNAGRSAGPTSRPTWRRSSRGNWTTHAQRSPTRTSKTTTHAPNYNNSKSTPGTHPTPHRPPNSRPSHWWAKNSTQPPVPTRPRLRNRHRTSPSRVTLTATQTRLPKSRRRQIRLPPTRSPLTGKPKAVPHRLGWSASPRVNCRRWTRPTARQRRSPKSGLPAKETRHRKHRWLLRRKHVRKPHRSRCRLTARQPNPPRKFIRQQRTSSARVKSRVILRKRNSCGY